MQVVILCGGQGTRIRDVSDDIPKPMIPIGGKPILWHIMMGYAQHGYKDFVLCLGYKSWAIKRFFLDYHLAGADVTVSLDRPNDLRIHTPNNCEDWRVTLVETGLENMTGSRVKQVEKYIVGNTFLLTYGDGVSDVDIPRQVAFHREHGKIGTVTTVQPPGRYGEIQVEGSQVVEFMEKPLLSAGRISGGFFVLQRSIFSRLRNDPELIFEQEPLMSLTRDGELMAYDHQGFWHAMDSSRDFSYLNGLWNKGGPWATWLKPAARLAA